MGSFNKGLEKVTVELKWDPSPAGAPDHDLDLVAATYPADAPYGDPGYLVHFDSRSPDGTITLNRDSRTGQGLGIDESMTLELARLAPAYGRVVVGVAIQQNRGRVTFGEVANPSVRVVEDHTELARDDFARVPQATAVAVAEFTRDSSGAWTFRQLSHGFDTDPNGFTRQMGRRY